MDTDGKPSEPFSGEIFLHELVYDEDHLVSRWSFDEPDVGIIREIGYWSKPAAFGRRFNIDGGEVWKCPYDGW